MDEIRSTLRHVRNVLPQGRSLPDDVWARRHRGVVILLYAHAVAIVIFAYARGFGLGHSLQEGGIVAVLAAFATLKIWPRKAKSALGALGLITCSAILVHISSGSIEMHFHFFVALGVLTLYEDWITFLMALGYVVVHHGFFGLVDPSSVFNHAAAQNDPWTWALIHGLFVTAASIVLIISWRISEIERERAEEFRHQLAEADLLRQQALEINDNIVQGLAVAQMAIALGRQEESRTAVEETLAKSRQIISALLDQAGSDGHTSLRAGDLVRAQPATVKGY